ncbi:H2AJ protein, partial [Pelecanoides urinatrix]|nr:H2AJ protein [Pelecanoides urinatrix]
KTKTHSSQTKLQFPINQIHHLLHKNNYTKQINTKTPIYLTTILKYLTTKILKLTNNTTHNNKKTHIIPHHLQLTIHNNKKLNKLLNKITITQNNILPNIQTILLPKKT